MMKLNGKPLDVLRVVDLKEELTKRDLPKHGKKQDLIQRLAAYLQQNPQECDAEDDGGGGEAPPPPKQVILAVSNQCAPDLR